MGMFRGPRYTRVPAVAPGGVRSWSPFISGAGLCFVDGRCGFEMRRMDTMPRGQRHTTGRNYSRMWRVQIWLRGDESTAVTSEFGVLARALEAGPGRGAE